MHKITFLIEKKTEGVQCLNALGKKIKIILPIQGKLTTKNILEHIKVVLIHPKSLLSYDKIILFFFFFFPHKKNTENRSNFLTTENTNNKFLKLVISCIQISKPEIIKDEKKNTKNYPSPQNPLCVLKKFNPLKYPRLQINSSQDKTD